MPTEKTTSNPRIEASKDESNPPRINGDPQVKLKGRVHDNGKSEMVVFAFVILFLVECTVIVPVPHAGTKEVPVYLKFRLLFSRKDNSSAEVL